MTPQLAARLADMVGADAMQAIAQATVDGEKDPKVRGVLKEILGKARAAGEAATLRISYDDAWNKCSSKVHRLTDSALNNVFIVLARLQRFLIKKRLRPDHDKEFLSGGFTPWPDGLRVSLRSPLSPNT